MASAVRAVRSARLIMLAFWLLAGAACARPDSALVIGVAGNDELAAQLERVASGRSFGGHPLAVRRIQRGESLAGLHVLYASSADAAASVQLAQVAPSGLKISARLLAAAWRVTGGA